MNPPLIFQGETTDFCFSPLSEAASYIVSQKKPCYSCPSDRIMCSILNISIQVVVIGFFVWDLSRKKNTQKNGGPAEGWNFFGLEAFKMEDWTTESRQDTKKMKSGGISYTDMGFWLVVVGTSNRCVHKFCYCVFLSKNTSDFNIAQRTTLPLMANLYYPRNAGSVKHVKPPTVWTRCCHLTQNQNPKKHRYEYMNIYEYEFNLG